MRVQDVPLKDENRAGYPRKGWIIDSAFRLVTCVGDKRALVSNQSDRT